MNSNKKRKRKPISLVLTEECYDGKLIEMRYLVKARLKTGKMAGLLRAIKDKTLGIGSIANGEYLRNMKDARKFLDGTVRWVEVCFCLTPLQEELPYWEEYFEFLEIKNAHNPQKCKDLNDTESWACSNCDCTKRLEARISTLGRPFLSEIEGETSKDYRK